MICIGAFPQEYLVSPAPSRFYRPSGLVRLWKKTFQKVCPFCFRDRSSTPITPQLKEVAVTKRSKWGSVMKIGLIGATLCLCLVGISHAQPAHASIRKATNIPAEELGSALATVAKDYDFQVLYRTEIVKDLRTQGAVGSLTSDEVLTKVLSGTGLTYKYLDSNTVTIMQAPAGAADQSPSDWSNGGGKKSSQDFRVAQVDQGANSQSSAVGSNVSGTQENENNGGLKEIIVSAQKRNERLQDVPVPVTSISGEVLVENNLLQLQDYYSRVPGLNVSPSSSTGNQMAIAIRGITTGIATNPTVGVLVDDVPIGSSIQQGGGDTIPDLDPGDLARVEVLRGPQGTLYGANSMGGLIKFVTADPSTDAVTARIQAGTDGIHNGSGPGYNFRGSVNVPVSDTVAVRASAFTREDPGYIDNPTLGINGINEQRVSGGHLAALWRPSDVFSVKLSALYQYSEADGANNEVILPGVGDLEQNYARGVGGYYRRLEDYSATIVGKVGGIDIISTSGYVDNKFADSLDYSYALAPLAQQLFGVGGVLDYGSTHDGKFSQEIRLSSSIGTQFDWLLGGFYNREVIQYVQNLYAIHPASGATAGLIVASNNYGGAYEEYAGFTDLTYHFTDRFDVQVGGRQSYINYPSGPSVTTGPFVGGATLVAPSSTYKADAFTYLVTPRFRFSPDFMVYARAASGYRPGSGVFNPPATATCVIFKLPCELAPDKTKNYELGAKADVLDHKLSLDASVYYIDWTGIQLNLASPSGIDYSTNGGKAKSQGLELAANARPTEDLTVSAWVVFSDAVLTQNLGANSTAAGNDGDRLPNSSRFSSNLSLKQNFPLIDNWIGFAGGTLAYIGNSEGPFQRTFTRQYFPAYAKTDLVAGARRDSWTVNIFANNVADKRAIIGGGLGTYPPDAFTVIQPRTVGINVVKTF
jgi:iron complex outermembrane receptor protein